MRERVCRKCLERLSGRCWDRNGAHPIVIQTDSERDTTIIVFPSPPGSIVQVLAQKAAWDRGFSIELPAQGPWLGFASSTVPGEIWIAGIPPHGPFALSVTHPWVSADLASNHASKGPPGPGGASVLISDDEALTDTVDRIWKLAGSLPPTPLAAFEAATASLPRTTDAERLVIQRIGQDKFRDALMLYWNGACPLTGITDPALLRASHIIPWAECTSDSERLDVANGLLLSSLWDAAFDAHLVSFEEDGAVIVSPRLSQTAASVLAISTSTKLSGLSDGHRLRLSFHRAKTLS